jgi:non-specific protein-tyrosine kinase
MEIRRYFALARKWAWLVILGALVGGISAYVININTEPVYRASARLLIDEAPESGGNEYAQALFEERLASTYVELISLRPVLEETVARLGLPFSADTLSGRLSIGAPSQAQIIVISVEDTDPNRAALIANTIGDVFMDLNNERESSRFAESIASYEAQMTSLQEEIRAIETQIFALGEPESPEGLAQLSLLETSRREAQLRYTEAFNSLEGLRVEEARASNNLIPVEPALPPGGPIRPQTTTNAILGAAIGAIVAIGIAFLVEFMDDTVRTPEQVRTVADISTLGAVTHIRGNNLPGRLITFNLPRSPISEAFRVIRTNLGFAAIDEELRTMVITSSSPGEGKSTISANLAVVMAQTGKQVIIVDSDLRRPTQHQVFSLPNNRGLTSALLDSTVAITDHLQQTKVAGLRVLTSGPIPPNPSELLNSQRMGSIIEVLREDADLVIFDTPPALTVADAIILAPQVNGCVLVVDAGQTRQHSVAQAAERLRNSGANILGAVINQLKAGASGYYYEDYYRYYDHASKRSRRRPGRGGLRVPDWLSLGKRS